MRFFRKRVPATPLFLSNGQKLKFPDGGDGWGYFRTGDGFYIAQLEGFQARHVGDVEEIDEALFNAAHKKKVAEPLHISIRSLRRSEAQANQFEDAKSAEVVEPEVEVEEDDLPPPIEVPKDIVPKKPVVGKRKRAKRK